MLRFPSDRVWMETSWPPEFGKESLMITIAKALKTVLSNVRPLKTTRRPLGDAQGFCLADDIRADRDLPPTDRSAMDGYAMRAKDLSRPLRELRLVGEVAAGSAKCPKVSPGECVYILTGASVPPTADTVVKQEETQELDGVVKFHRTTKLGANIRRQGEEARKGQVILPKGTILHAVQIGFCAAVGKATVRVYRRPRIAVFCTGQELRSPASRVSAHQLRNSNGPALVAALGEAGIENIAHEIVPDDLKTLTAKLRAAVVKHDVVILTGGVSVGKYDYVSEAVTAIGAKVRFHGVAMKPGKPQLYATASKNRHIFGLPGNPLSALTGFHELVIPAIRRMSGYAPGSCHMTLKLPLAGSLRSHGKRATFFPCKFIHSNKGLRIKPIRLCGSADLAAGAQADGVALVPRNVRELSAGELVDFSPWRPLQ